MLPLEFIKRIENQLGNVESQAFFDSLNHTAPVSIRLNKQKFKITHFDKGLKQKATKNMN